MNVTRRSRRTACHDMRMKLNDRNVRRTTFFFSLSQNSIARILGSDLGRRPFLLRALYRRRSTSFGTRGSQVQILPLRPALSSLSKFNRHRYRHRFELITCGECGQNCHGERGSCDQTLQAGGLLRPADALRVAAFSRRWVASRNRFRTTYLLFQQRPTLRFLAKRSQTRKSLRI